MTLFEAPCQPHTFGDFRARDAGNDPWLHLAPSFYTTHEQKHPMSDDVPMIYSDQLKEMVSAIRNINAHSPPPLERPDDDFAMEYHMMVQKSEQKSLEPDGSAAAALFRTCKISPRPIKRKRPITLDFPIQGDHLDLSHPSIRPPSPGSPHRTNAENLRHDPVFENCKEFFQKLKSHFMEMLWFDDVDSILGRELSTNLVYFVAERVVRPSEFFYTIAAEEFMAHDNFVDFLVVVKQRVGQEWDERLTQPAHVFFVTARTASKAVGVFGGRQLQNSDLMEQWDDVIELCRHAIDNSVMSPQRENDLFFDEFLREGRAESEARIDPFLSLGDQMDLSPRTSSPFSLDSNIDDSSSSDSSRSCSPSLRERKKRNRAAFTELNRWQELAASVSRRIRQRKHR